MCRIAVKYAFERRVRFSQCRAAKGAEAEGYAGGKAPGARSDRNEGKKKLNILALPCFVLAWLVLAFPCPFPCPCPCFILLFLLAFPFLSLPCLALPYLVLSCRALSYFALPGPVFFALPLIMFALLCLVLPCPRPYPTSLSWPTCTSMLLW
jgi:hypothetical protein